MSSPPTPSLLARPVSALFGVGPERAELLQNLDILTVEDLVLYRPRRYEDRRQFSAIAALEVGQATATRGTIVASGVKWFKKHTKSIYEFILDDGTGRLHCRWWNLPFMEKYFSKGDEVVVYGKLESLKPRTMDHPEHEMVEAGAERFIHFNRITPIYALTEGLTQRWVRALVWRTLESVGPRDHRTTGPQDHGPRVRGANTTHPPSLRYGAASQTPNSKLQTPETLATGPSPLAPHTSSLDSLLISRAAAVRMLHFPERLEEAEAARQRLALDEFIELQRQIQARRKNFETKAQALPCGGDNRLIKPFLAQLGFKLTDAQTEVLRQLRKDLSARHPMRRLLQGDVGSGKTVVAACCALMTIESGHTVALMAPTDILAQQHFATFKRWLEPLGVPVELLTGSRRIANTKHQTPNTKETPSSKVQADRGQRTERSSGGEALGGPPFGSGFTFPVLAAPKRGEAGSRSTGDTPHLTIGTHTLIEAGFAPDNLGLVIIDEQHKFGVAQREQLLRKGHYPHLLVMTATPIPRTLGLTVYGDLDVSSLVQMPPGRGRTRTFVRSADKLPKVWAFAREKLAEGRQAIVIYPRIEETDVMSQQRSAPACAAEKGRAPPGGGIKAVKREFENVRRILDPFHVGLLHGRLSPHEQEAVMSGFRTNKIAVLLATSMIEVGLDVPNATVLLIENAEQFGLAQLHQMRGRIGRGSHDSYCILVSGVKTDEARERLRVLEQTTDGFRIAEADLELRGPGELLGSQQSGAPRLRFGDLARDWPLIQEARRLVAQETTP